MRVRVFRWYVAAAALFAAAGQPLHAGHYTWTTAGPEPGTIYQILAYSQNPNRLYVASSIYGAYLFRTDDRGQNWCYLDSLWPVPYVVPDPTNPDVLYAPGWPTVVKTIDGGQSWQPADAGLPQSYALALALAPSSPLTLYAVAGAAPARLYLSTDGGSSWNVVSGNLPQQSYWALTVDAFDAATLYAFEGQTLIKSVDGGATWSPAGAGLPAYAGRVFSDPRTPSTLYSPTSADGLYKSTDGGASFFPAEAGIEDHYVSGLAFDFSDPLRLYAATNGTSSPDVSGGLFASSDAGASWAPVDIGFSERHFASAVAVDPGDSSRLYVGAGANLRGNFLESSDGGSTWTHAEKGLSGYYAYTVAAHPGLPNAAYGFSGARFFGTSDSGESWTLLTSPGYTVSSLLFDPTNSSILYGQYNGYSDPTFYGGVYKSLDGGSSWEDASAGLTSAYGYGLAIGVSDPATLLASSGDGAFKTSDAGASWQNVLTGNGRAVAVDPADPQILYASRQYSIGQISFLRSADGGVSWQQPAGFAEYASPYDLAIPPGNPDVVYALLSNAVYKSTDRGLSFAPASSGLEGIDYPSFYRLVLDPAAPSTLYAAGNQGAAIFRSTDAAAEWRPLAPRLHALILLDFSVSATGHTLWAATAAGVFQLERSFLDVPESSSFWSSIDAAAMNGVTSGCGGGNFCPTSANTRAQIAPMLLRGKNGAGYLPPAATGSAFADVPASSFAAAWIEELARTGIASGCGGGDYCPGAALSRASLAVMLLKAKHGASYEPPPATGTVFIDVPADAFAAAWIEELYAEGITAGCGGGSFCPADPVLRSHAAALVVRALSLP